ncbi:MAG: hypothetical protein QNL91_02480 [Candidatus Krumholzibacteria bacterium]|nr:hypothetical protein [Candidatus Krumholzibacteria bacterium]
MNIWNSWAFHYRNARGMAVAGILLLAIVAMLSLRCNPMVGREDILGLVLEIEAEGLHPLGDGESMSRVLVAVQDSLEVRLLLPPPVPRPGHFIPLKVESYKKGNQEFYLDQEKWRIDGPS